MQYIYAATQDEGSIFICSKTEDEGSIYAARQGMRACNNMRNPLILILCLAAYKYTAFIPCVATYIYCTLLMFLALECWIELALKTHIHRHMIDYFTLHKCGV